MESTGEGGEALCAGAGGVDGGDSCMKPARGLVGARSSGETVPTSGGVGTGSSSGGGWVLCAGAGGLDGGDS